MAELVLYHRQACPFCKKVRDFLEKNNKKINMKDTGKWPQYNRELLVIGGKSQVPCLVIDGKPLFESDDIIRWFENNA